MNTQQAIQNSLSFLKHHFQKYYENATLHLPDRFGRREFAFVMFGGKGMIRHQGFDKKQAIEQYLTRQGPQHVYYSSAYYQYPDAPTMQEKEWMGAELIFDLDSDHLPNAEALSYTDQLIKVKSEFKKLVEEFLVDDFGFQKKHLELYFSGGRGYHCHVKDPLVFDLDSNERRELVDYITGRDLQDSVIFREEITGRKSYGRQSYPSSKRLKMPTPDQKGWKGRISRGILEIIDEIRTSENPVQKLQEYGVKEKDAHILAAELSDERMQRIREGNLDQSKTIRKFFLNNVLRKTAVSLGAGETDEPVTCDVKRLIRLPDSLHGKTGFQVVRIDIDKLDQFHPLDDALAFGDEQITIHCAEPYSIEMNHTHFSLNSGEQTVPLYLAIFLIGRRLATVTEQS